MILNESRIAITLKVGDRSVTFSGEWASNFKVDSDGNLVRTNSDSKFYCDRFIEKFWDEPYADQKLSTVEIEQCKQIILNEAKRKDWIIVFE